MSEVPNWLRVFNILAGIGFLCLGFGVVLNFGLTQQIMIIILSFALVLVCLTRIVNGLSDPMMTEKFRYLNIFVGGFGLSMATTVIVLPDLAIITALFLLSVGLSVQGIARIATGGADQTMANWLRGLFITVGIITLILSLIVIFIQTTDESILIILLAYAFIANAIARIVKGIVKSQD